MTPTRSRVVAAMFAIVLFATRDAGACATVQGVAAPVPVASEEALIVWDATHHVEHFIRGAQFGGGGEGMGFVVPTPSRPELAALESDPFPALDRALRPRERRVIDRRVVPGCSLTAFMMGRSASSEIPAAQSVEVSAAHVAVLEERRVGPYDAAVLSADNADALAQWLGSHGFVSRPPVAAWLQPYIDHHWILTAFRIAPVPGASVNRLPAVRMTFPTDRPFYPYSEPAEAPGASAPAGRALHVFLVAETGYEAGRGDAFLPWSASMPLSASLGDEPDATRVAPALAAVRALGLALPANPWLTAFRDTSSPRLGDLDLFFRPRTPSPPVRPPEQVVHRTDRVEIPLDCVLVPVGVIALLVARVRRRRRAKAAEIGAVYRRGKVDP